MKKAIVAAFGAALILASCTTLVLTTNDNVKKVKKVAKKSIDKMDYEVPKHG